MHVKDLMVKGTWRQVADAARTTIGMDAGDKEPSNRWKKSILLAEHSPIRKLIFSGRGNENKRREEKRHETHACLQSI